MPPISKMVCFGYGQCLMNEQVQLLPIGERRTGSNNDVIHYERIRRCTAIMVMAHDVRML